MSLNVVPEVYKPIATYVRVANQFQTRDPVLYYWSKNASFASVNGV